MSKRVLHFRSGKNDCVISSGIKSCIPCRLQKCLQVFIVLLSEKKVLQNHPDRLTNSFLCIKSLNLDFVLYSKCSNMILNIHFTLFKSRLYSLRECTTESRTSVNTNPPRDSSPQCTAHRAKSPRHASSWKGKEKTQSQICTETK